MPTPALPPPNEHELTLPLGRNGDYFGPAGPWVRATAPCVRRRGRTTRARPTGLAPPPVCFGAPWTSKSHVWSVGHNPGVASQFCYSLVSTQHWCPPWASPRAPSRPPPPPQPCELWLGCWPLYDGSGTLSVCPWAWGAAIPCAALWPCQTLGACEVLPPSSHRT